MHIGIFTLRDMNLAGGSWLRIVGPTQYLHELGCKVTFFAPSFPNALEGKAEFVPIQGVSGNPEPWRRRLLFQGSYAPLLALSRALSFKRGLTRTINDRRLDLIHCHGHSGGLLLLREKPRINIPIAFDIHTLYHLQLQKGTCLRERLAHHFTLRAEKRLFRDMDALTVESEQQKASVLENSGADPNRVFSCPSGADMDFLSQPIPVEEVQSLRQELGLSETQRIILFAGAFKPESGVLDLIQAFRILARERTNLSLLLIGDVNDMSPEQRSALDRTDLGDIMLLGRQPRERYRLFQRIADVIAVPDIDSGFTRLFPPLKLYDVLASGKPAVITRVQSREKMIDNGLTGYLVTPEDPADMARGIVRALDDPKAQDVGQRAQAKIRQSHTFQKTAEAFAEAYRKILALSPR